MSKLRELELITTVDLRYAQDTGKPAYHFIYASELYGTIFVVYAQFEGKEIDVEGEKAFSIESINFKLVNYKGLINIGFTSHPLDWSHGDDEAIDYVMDFGVRGASTIVDKEHTFNNKDGQKESSDSFVVKKGKRLRVKFVRTLFPLPDFEGYQDNSIIVNPVDPTELKDEPPITPLFDTEFNYRDGAYLHLQPLRAGMLDTQMPAVGHRCNESDVSFLYF